MKRQVVSSAKRPKKAKSSKKRVRPAKVRRSPAISAAGLAFQKCTLAPADFQDTGFAGIPDEFDGQVVSKKHTLVGSLPSYTTGHDLYIVQMPIPGIAYFYGDRAAGSTSAITLTPVSYDDSATLFPAGGESQNIAAFRQASNVIEFVPTVNSMTWGGSIEVYKAKVRLTEAPGAVASSVYQGFKFLEGLEEAMNGKKPSSVFALKDGCYVPCFNSEATYEWQAPEIAFTWAVMNANVSAGPSYDSAVTYTTGGTPNFVGLGSFETSIIKFPAIIASQTGLLRAWSCVEYQVSNSSILYDYTHMSPTYDPIALALVKAFHKNSPSAVPWKDNASFWENFRKWAGLASEAASYLPGPIGMIGKGFNSIFKSTALAKGLF